MHDLAATVGARPLARLSQPGIVGPWRGNRAGGAFPRDFRARLIPARRAGCSDPFGADDLLFMARAGVEALLDLVVNLT
jgi:hypothetical protein